MHIEILALALQNCIYLTHVSSKVDKKFMQVGVKIMALLSFFGSYFNSTAKRYEIMWALRLPKVGTHYNTLKSSKEN